VTDFRDLYPKVGRPPGRPVEWLAVCAATKSRTTVTAKTWFEARKASMQKLGCGPGELVVEMKEEKP